MVKRELVQWRYVWTAHKPLFVIPLLLWLLAVIAGTTSQQFSKEMTALVLYPALAFPMLGLMSQIGSSEQKELWITLPAAPWKAGALRPLLLSLLYAGLYAAVLRQYFDAAEVWAGFVSAMLYMQITAALVALFKHNAFGLCLALCYLFFGMFAGGSGQGPLYLLQWYRQKLGTTPEAFVTVQAAACASAAVLTAQLIRFRESFHLLKD
ncbi:hypothetical protein [Paenibacillus sambharensis]|uniref:hypothetical protein n=1 Tax=Paenibacillus sambharensis TaxID=1803190 RepID=UPI0011B50D66|nr:hypothetical protein [Paenibacillus sambharensis]